MCLYSVNTDLDHLELFCRKRIRIINTQEGSLCFLNEGTSPVEYLFVINLPLVILNGFNAGK